MKYQLLRIENDFISASFSDDVQIDARVYSTISHNTAILIPGTRDRSAANVINYDTLGSISMLDELQQNNFDKQSLYGFVSGILDTLEKILALGMDERQIVFDCSHVYVSLYDKSVRFICLPVSGDNVDPVCSAAEMFKTIALSVKSEGAYELLGYMIERTAAAGFSISEFKQGLEKIFSSGQSTTGQISTPANVSQPQQEIKSSPAQFDSSGMEISENVYSGREYVPSGVPFAYNGNVQDDQDTIDPDNKTQVLFVAAQELGDIPYLSPIDNNTPEARIYIAGEKLSVGRSSENDLHINVATVSGKHAEIHRAGGRCTLTDLNSTNGTYINGTAIKPNAPVVLKHQDLVAFNKVRYRFFDH